MKKSFHISHFTFHIVIAFCAITAEEFVPIVAIHESGSIVNTTYFNSGAAFPANASSMSLNPAIPAAWHYYSKSKMSVFGSYYQNGDVDYMKTGGGGSLALGKGQYVSLEYNLKKETDELERKFNRGTIAYGAMVGDDKAPLFIGTNLSFYNFSGIIPKSGLLPIVRDTVSHNKVTEYYNSSVYAVSAKNNFIAADLGFYQPSIGKGLSWGVVLENILGYSWSEYDQTLRNKRDEKIFIDTISYTNDFGTFDTIVKTPIRTDSAYYVAGIRKSNNFLSPKYNSFLLATNATIPMANDKVLMMIPADIRFWGFINKDLRRHSKLRYRTEVHSGFELQFAGRVSTRFGWGWVPEKYTTDENGQLNFNGWDNRFSGGIGVNIGPITIDAMGAKEAFGVGLSFKL